MMIQGRTRWSQGFPPKESMRIQQALDKCMVGMQQASGQSFQAPWRLGSNAGEQLKIWRRGGENSDSNSKISSDM